MVENVPAISITNLSFRFSNDIRSFSLKIASFKIEQGERVALVGPSGSGKSTLLGLICGVISPVDGSVCVLGHHLEKMSGRERDKFRANTIGVIFQQFNLLPYLSVLDNVTLALEFSSHRNLSASDKQSKAKRLLTSLGLGEVDMTQQKASQLSVGQQQRVAAARAFVGEPPLIIADEPTSALDQDRQTEFIETLFAQQKINNATLVMVTHDLRVANQFDRVLDLRDICDLSKIEAIAS